MRRDAIRLQRPHRYLFYFLLAALFLTGVYWAYIAYLIESPNEAQSSWKSLSMKIHGAAAMSILVVVGTILHGHVRFAWRARRNRANGVFFLAVFAILIVTGYGLYYAGGEMMRAWTSWIHLGVGLALPLLLVVHIFLGRKTRPQSRKIDM